MPNFGLLKEQIFADIEKKYTEDKNLFEEGVKKFVKTLKKSKTYSELFTHYKNILDSHFDDSEYAKEYLNETISYLQSLKITDKDRRLMESLDRADLKLSDIDPHVKALDTLVFSKSVNVKERLEAKQILQRKMVSENKKVQIDPRLNGVFLDILQKKLKAKWSSLSESEIKAINSFVDNDEEAILSNYISIIDDNINSVQEQIALDNDPSLRSNLIKVKNTLAEMKNEKPTLTSLEKLFSLKEGFIN